MNNTVQILPLSSFPVIDTLKSVSICILKSSDQIQKQKHQWGIHSTPDQTEKL